MVTFCNSFSFQHPVFPDREQMLSSGSGRNGHQAEEWAACSLLAWCCEAVFHSQMSRNSWSWPPQLSLDHSPYPEAPEVHVHLNWDNWCVVTRVWGIKEVKKNKTKRSFKERRSTILLPPEIDGSKMSLDTCLFCGSPLHWALSF